MDCHELDKSLKGFLSGELSREDAEAIRKHLARCRDCRLRLDPVDRVEILPAIDEAAEPSADLGARFHARLRLHRSRSHAGAWHDPWRILHALCTPRRLAAAALAAACIVAAVLVGGRWWKPQEPEAIGTDIAVAENLPLLRDMDVISNLELLENFEEIQAAAQDSGTGH